MALGEALTEIGTWPAALAVGSEESWRRICGDAARKTQCPRKREAWAALARSGRANVAVRLNAHGIRI